MCRLAVALAPLILLSGCGPSAFAQENAGSPTVVGAGAPVLAFASASQTGIIALTEDVAPGRREIVARRIDSNGLPLTAPVQLSLTPPGFDVGRPDVVFNPKVGEYLVVWRVARRGSERASMRARRVSLEGVTLGAGDFAVGASSISAFTRPVIAAAGTSGGYLVAFETPGATVRARVLDNFGAVVRETPRLSGQRSCGDPRVVYRDRGREYLLGWSCESPGGGAATYHTQRVGSSGAQRGRDVVVSTPRDSMRGSGEAALAYDRSRDAFLVAVQARGYVRTRRLDGRGGPRGPWRNLRPASFQLQTRLPAVGFDARTGDFLVSWVGFRRGPRGEPLMSLFFSRLNRDGQERGARGVLGAGDFPSVVARGPLGGFLVSYVDEPSPGRQEGAVRVLGG